jgi:hypothetical protein
MRWRIRRIVNGCAAQQLAARRDVIAPGFISCCLAIRAINSEVYLNRVLTNRWSSRLEGRLEPLAFIRKEDRPLVVVGGAAQLYVMHVFYRRSFQPSFRGFTTRKLRKARGIVQASGGRSRRNTRARSSERPRARIGFAGQKANLAFLDF